ncbi:MAG: DMT family transporter [Alphaproteobacteria bacterium]|nr:DMT family transporter [Alphaproteobacteria bacterium]
MTERTTSPQTGTADRGALAALLLGAVLVGASPIFVRLSELGPMATAFYRPFLAIPVLALWLAVDRRNDPATRRPASRGDYLRLLLAGAFFAGDLAFWHLSILHTSVANATLFANFAPIFVTLGAWLLFAHRVTRLYLTGLALALTGAALLAGGSLAVEPGNLLGDLFGVVTAMFLASYILAMSRLRAGFSAATTMTWSSIGTAAVLLPVAALVGEELIAVTLYGWTMLIGLALLSHAAGQGLIAYALAHLRPGFSSVGLLLEPVAAALLAWIVLSEAVTPWQAAGGGVILWGIFLARWGSR